MERFLGKCHFIIDSKTWGHDMLRGQNTMWKVDSNMQSHVHTHGSAYMCMYTQTHPAFSPENVLSVYCSVTI